MVSALGGRAWNAALALIGVRFRLHGRDPASGLDCVGLVAAAYRAAGYPISDLPDRYRLSGPEPSVAEQWLARCGAAPVHGTPRTGDVLLADLGMGMGRQLHLLLAGPCSVIHAHAGLRRVVQSPASPDVQVACWRIDDGDDEIAKE